MLGRQQGCIKVSRKKCNALSQQQIQLHLLLPIPGFYIFNVKAIEPIQIGKCVENPF